MIIHSPFRPAIIKFLPPTNTKGGRLSISRGPGTPRNVYSRWIASSIHESLTRALQEYLHDQNDTKDYVIGEVPGLGWIATVIPPPADR